MSGNRKCVQIISFGMGGFFDISVFEIRNALINGGVC